MLALCLLGGFMLSKEVIPEVAIKYMAWVICGAAAFVGCWSAQKRAASARLPVCLASAGILLAMMLAVSALKQDRSSLSWYSAAIVGACAVAAAMLGAGKRKRHR